LFAGIIEAQKTDRLATDSLRKLAGTEGDYVMQEAGSEGGHVTGHVTKPISDEHDWAVSAGALTYEGRVYVPEGLRSKVTALHHDNPKSGHFGALKTAELVSRNFY
jgi:hypothetical protein